MLVYRRTRTVLRGDHYSDPWCWYINANIGGYIHGKCYTIYGSTMDPMGKNRWCYRWLIDWLVIFELDSSSRNYHNTPPDSPAASCSNPFIIQNSSGSKNSGIWHPSTKKDPENHHFFRGMSSSNLLAGSRMSMFSWGMVKLPKFPKMRVPLYRWMVYFHGNSISKWRTGGTSMT